MILARITHERFCGNRRSTVTASLVILEMTMPAGSPLGLSPYCRVASGPHGSVRRSRDAAQRFRDEPS